ncbi:glycosyltransferase family 9 protein [Chitinophaga flava]|uniref:Glycosyltransferase family 9 protein n=1 Tax=Chitinophaga flava TaxID=2259036 RepID=A0A365XPV0_9BACT|nr:glycosyltransferase family 9 protein [Chitinophaga flava]RBL88148.1 hypothetical protein DF182_32015 [Chitinophaga flava]
MEKKIFRIVVKGGLGDVLLLTPTMKAIKQTYPNSKIMLFCFNERQKSIFENNPHVDKVYTTSFWSNPISYIRVSMKWGKFYKDFYGGLIPTVFYNENAKMLIAGLYDVELQDDKVQVFLTQQEEEKARQLLSKYKNPVLLHITSKTSKNQEWKHSNWDELITSMPDCTFLQLGVMKEEKVEKAVDLRGLLSFRETLALIKYASSFVGVNSSFSHATNAFDIPGVVIFGPAQPDIWGHPNNINIYKPMRCSPCLDLIFAAKCPYDKACMDRISVTEVREALRSQLQFS